MDKKSIAEFLSHFKNYYIQTLDDKLSKSATPQRKEAKKGLISDGEPSEYTMTKLLDLNADDAGIFFSPNQFKGRRKKNECLGVNAWIAEMDDIPKAEQMVRLIGSPIPPSVIVETRNSYHSYWMAKDGTVENYDRIVRGLIQYFSSDSACSDISRVFRIPGFNHNKNDPFMVSLYHAAWEQERTEKEMMEAFPYEAAVYKTVTRVNAPLTDGLDLWDAISRLSNKDALQRLSGSHLVSYEQITFRERASGGEHIDINGVGADCWLDEHGMIGSGKGAGPTFVQWLGYYGWSKGDIAKWVKENFKEILPKSALISKPRAEEEPKAKKYKFLTTSDLKAGAKALIFDKSNMPYTWGTDGLDNKFSPVRRGTYMILAGETGLGKTAFTYFLARQNAILGNTVLYISLEMTNDGVLSRYARDKAGIVAHELRRSGVIPDRKEALFDGVMDTVPENIVFVDLGGGDKHSVAEIDAVLTQKKFDLVIIDNLGFLGDDKEDGNEAQKKISRGILQVVQKHKQIWLIGIQHYKKGADGKPRSLEAIMGSAKFSHDVMYAVQVWRDKRLTADEDTGASEKQKAELQILVQKDRQFDMRGMKIVYFNKGEFGDRFLGSSPSPTGASWNDVTSTFPAARVV